MLHISLIALFSEGVEEGREKRKGIKGQRSSFWLVLTG
jgi:hypothetical protein